MRLIDLNQKFQQIKERVALLGFTDVTLPQSFKNKYETFLNEFKPNAYASVEWAKHSSKITTTNDKVIYVTNFWFYLASEISGYVAGLSNHKEIFRDIFKDQDQKAIAKALKKEVSQPDKKLITDYFTLHGLSDEELENFLSFVSKYDTWGGGKTVDRHDYIISPLLQVGNLLAETQSGIAEIAIQFSKNQELRDALAPNLLDQNDIKFIEDESLYLSLPKPFLLLAGISGTGKTCFVREQAKASGDLSETYCLTSVRPDWHEPSDLLGYVSRLRGTAEYVTTDVLQFIAKAWRAIAASGLSIDVENGQLIVQGDRSELNEVKPYWLCLDEMNLAPVEQYFADYLSVLETREWNWNDDSFNYTCDPLLKSAEINSVAQEKLKKDLGFTTEQNKVLWNQIVESGLPIPFNLIVAGTVNMDETTHGFSRKVIDRALSFDFGEYFPNDFDTFFDQQYVNKTLSYPLYSNANRDELASTYDPEGSQTIAFLKAINSVLRQTPFELAYRAVNELLLAVISAQPKDELTLKAVWDDFVMCKVLPRIEGDSDKLSTAFGDNLLEELLKVIGEQLLTEGNDRPDLYREKKPSETEDDDKIIPIPFKSKIKLEWMKQRLDIASFTSFWP